MYEQTRYAHQITDSARDGQVNRVFKAWVARELLGVMCAARAAGAAAASNLKQTAA